MKQAKSPPAPSGEAARLAKVIARSGLCSRREAERWILQHRVEVNGELVLSPALNVTEADKVVVDGSPLPKAQPVRLWRYHKVKGTVATNRDPEGRTTLFETLPSNLPRVISVGRLDINTEGLLLLTNDGALARYLELPDTGWIRRYRVRAKGSVEKDQLAGLKDGITIDGVDYGSVVATLDRQQGQNVWLTMGIREGRNREIKNIATHLGLQVNRLIRISFGPFQLGDLKPGDAEEVHMKALSEQLGKKKSRELTLDTGANRSTESPSAGKKSQPRPRLGPRKPRKK
ncbi:MAG: pseudouridine synthase [Methyloligellaceae bacterium]